MELRNKYFWYTRFFRCFACFAPWVATNNSTHEYICIQECDGTHVFVFYIVKVNVHLFDCLLCDCWFSFGFHSVPTVLCVPRRCIHGERKKEEVYNNSSNKNSNLYNVFVHLLCVELRFICLCCAHRHISFSRVLPFVSLLLDSFASKTKTDFE